MEYKITALYYFKGGGNMNWAFLFSSSLKLNKGSSSVGGPELLLTSIAL